MDDGSNMATWLRARSLRTGRSLRNRHDSDDEVVQLDFNKDPSENMKEILIHVVKKEGITKGKKLGYLNSLVKLCNKVENNIDFGLNLEEILCCLETALFHEAQEVRAAGLRAMRYLLKDEVSIDILLKLHLHLLIVRSLDIVLDNHTERIQALRLMRKVAAICPSKFPSAFTYCLVSIANDGSQEKDHLLRACLATLSELAILHTEACVKAGGISALIRNALDCQQPRISEAIIGTILYLLNHPRTRGSIRLKVDLEQVIAPFTDCHYRHFGETTDQQSEDREARFMASKLAILSILRSWPGMIRLCKPGESGLQSLVDVLYLPYTDVRKGIMDILFDLFQFPVPEQTEDFSVALLASDTSVMQESWKLYDGFVAEEAKIILAHVGKHRANLVENYLAVLLLAFISAGILEALVDVITTCECAISIRATILLGELLHMANTLLPYECSHHSHCLPTLIGVATSVEVSSQQRHQAYAAINCLHRLHLLKKRGPVPCSLFLDQLIQFIQKDKEKHSKKIKLLHCLKKDNEDQLLQNIKDSQVTSTRLPRNWDWELIGALLKWPSESLKKLEDNNQKLFIRRITQFFKPTANEFSHLEQEKDDPKNFSKIGCLLMDFLTEAEEVESTKILDEFLVDFMSCLSQIITERAPLDTIFSPNKMMSTFCQDYFLFIGRLSHSSKGRKALERTGVFQYLLELISITSHDCYLKLVISSLDYTQEGVARVIFTKVLTSSSESARIYATNFMRTLVRLQLPEFHKWGIELLVTQLYDKCRTVSLAAMEILDEACDNKLYLEALIQLRPSLLHLGDRGQLLFIRFLSLPTGFKFLSDANYINHELDKWRKIYNLKYVKIVEDELNDAITRHRRGEDGNYQRRTNQKHLIKDVFVPCHLYGQLVQHQAGIDLLREQDIVRLIQTVRFQEIQTDEQILHLKAALWALGHIGTSVTGINMLNDEQVIQDIVKLAEECPVFAIRGTCFYVLGLLSSTHTGAELLSQLGWETVRHHRREKWPVMDETGLDNSSSDVFFREEDEYEEDEEEQHSHTSSHASAEELDGRAAFFICGQDEEDGQDSNELNLSKLIQFRSNKTRRLRAGYSLDGGGTDKMLYNSEKSYTLPPPSRSKSMAPITSIYHQRSMSETQAPSEDWDPHHQRNGSVRASLDPGSTGSLHSSPRCSNRPRLKVTTKERNRSRSFTDSSPSPVGVQSSNASSKLRSISNIEITHSQSTDYPDSLVAKEERSDSNESSHTSKSRSDSCTDSNSGVDSSDSGVGRMSITEHAQTLSPIASSTSLNTIASKAVHHSDSTRKLVNLRHTPVVLRRVASIPRGQLSPDFQSDSMFVYTSPRDALGFATLRLIQRRRNMSVDSDPSSWMLSHDQRTLKTRSLEAGRESISNKILRDFMANPLQYQPSVVSHSSSTRSFRKTVSQDEEEVRYMGLCLPVDISMIFSVDDTEERRLSGLSRIDEQAIEINPVDWRHSTSKGMSDPLDDGMIYHSFETCLSCSRLQAMRSRTNSQNASKSFFERSFSSEKLGPSPLRLGQDSPGQGRRPLKSRANSSETSAATTPGSFSSVGSGDLVGPRRTVEDSAGRTLIRKEVLKFITYMCSTVAVNFFLAEQGLLSMKQKFPTIFQDLCLYSEILHQMSQYNFRLSSRRFIQELFLDVNFDELFEEPLHILNISESSVTINPSTEEDV